MKKTITKLKKLLFNNKIVMLAGIFNAASLTSYAQCIVGVPPSTFNGCTSGYSIDVFKINSISSPYSAGCSGGSLGYGSFTTTPTFTINTDVQTTFTISTSSMFSQRYGIWIDLNKNGVYENIELMATNNAAMPSYSGFFNIPAYTVLTGTYSLRVRAAFYVNTACDYVADGETEDYVVQINSTYVLSGSGAAKALNFDGDNDEVSVPTATNFPISNSPFTLEAFIKPTAMKYGIVFGWGKYGNANQANYIMLDPFGNVGSRHWSSNDLWTTHLGTIDLYDGNWHHVATTYDGTTKYIYLDGILSNSLVVTGLLSIPNATNVTIGNAYGISFKGGIDEVKVWSRALSETEIQTNKNCQLTLPQVGLEAYYQFNQGIANDNNTGITSLTNLLGATNTGSLTNFTLNGYASNWATPGAVDDLPTVLATTNNTLLCTGQTAILTASGAITYTWNTTATTTVIAVSPTTTTVYTVTGTDANGCVNTTTITQDVSLCTGINAVAEALEATIQVYPNPTNGIITIELATINDNTKVELLNTLGQVLHWETATAKNLTLNIQNLNSGIYYLKANSNGNAKTIKIIKQ